MPRSTDISRSLGSRGGCEVKNVKKTNAPILRFTADNVTYSLWRAVKLGDIATFINGRAYSQEELLSKGKYRVLRVGNFFTNDEWYYSDMELDQEKYAENGDLLYAWSATFGPKIWKENKVVFHYHIWKVVPQNDVLKNFLYVLLLVETEKLYKMVNGGTMMHITKGTMENREVMIPSLPEQRKIGDFFIHLDRCIDLADKKLAALQNIKKGILQKIFSQELRFKDDEGKEFPAWKENRLGNLCSTFKSGQTITATQITEEGKYPVYGGNGLRGYTDTYTHAGAYVLIGRQGALCGNVNYVQGKNYLSEHAIAVQANKDNSTEFLRYMLEQMDLNRYSESSAQPGLSVKKLVRLKVMVPANKVEQQKIAAYFTALDRAIAAAQQKAAALRTIKRGLLQKMFV